MSDTSPNRIAELRKLRGMTQQALADAVGAHWITISKLERGKLPLSFEWAERIGHALGVGEFDVFRTRFAPNTVFVDGVIIEGGRAFYYKDEAGNLDHQAYMIEVETAQSPLKDWFIIENNALFPFFQTNDLVQVTYVDPTEIDLFIDRLCLVSMPIENTDKLNSVLGFVVNGRKSGFDLNIPGSAPLRDIKIEGVRPVTMALYNPPVWDQRSGRPRQKKA
ncbi:helix-turn-helix transcriptional regulator [Methylobacterium goesingense]|uniref:DNA-binding XRE family transcriptional regulator n=1 Tax=Methylobacterium goesingense TaxID=243690 RepID=A0ABV2L3G4_9HYPH|nr:helix-turn-helix transcriptional regulator [Methylobacterium goesingense]GJD73122.1 hypothetical protein CFIICLFH_1347 [Methylobacterium goesingense]